MPIACPGPHASCVTVTSGTVAVASALVRSWEARMADTGGSWARESTHCRSIPAPLTAVASRARATRRERAGLMAQGGEAWGCGCAALRTRRTSAGVAKERNAVGPGERSQQGPHMGLGSGPPIVGESAGGRGMGRRRALRPPPSPPPWHCLAPHESGLRASSSQALRKWEEAMSVGRMVHPESPQRARLQGRFTWGGLASCDCVKPSAHRVRILLRAVHRLL